MPGKYPDARRRAEAIEGHASSIFNAYAVKMV
jgi:hypothetical protein